MRGLEPHSTPRLASGPAARLDVLTQAIVPGSAKKEMNPPFDTYASGMQDQRNHSPRTAHATAKIT